MSKSQGADIAQVTRQAISPAVRRLMDLYRHMVAARCVDTVEQELVTNGEAFFHVSGAGHEGVAVLNLVLKPTDWLHCHYRDKALMLARGVSPEMFIHSVLCTEASHSAGRQMGAHMSARAYRILSGVGPVGNQALQAVGVAAAIRDQPERPIVYCGLGDGMTQEGEVLEAFAEAVRSRSPVLFVVENNGYAISTRTRGKTFFEGPDGKAGSFHGMPIHFVNGRRVTDNLETVEAVVRTMRNTRMPSVLVFNLDRLCSHTNADDDRVYRDRAEVDALRRTADPNRNLRDDLTTAGVPDANLCDLEEEVEREVREAAERARRTADPIAVFDAVRPLPEAATDPAIEMQTPEGETSRTMLEVIREVLRVRMASDERVTLFGEDIEDPKGDVFGVTRGLTEAFPGRVENSPLAEATIVGVSIGKALAGLRPVAFLQFADFLPLAFNQIAMELGSMYWRTAGQWECPAVVMIACGAYRPGLGPFHAHTFESTAAHVPGVDVMVPSTARDAAGMLNAAFSSGRPTLFFYPKVCLNEQNAATRVDVSRHCAALGRAHRVRHGDDLTLLGWGSVMPLAGRAAEALAGAGFGVDLIDLRFLSPWDRDLVCESAGRTGRLLIVHEDNLTCGFGAEVAATVAERASRQVRMRRLTRADTYIPCNFRNQLEVLPSYRRILEAAAELLDLDVHWEWPSAEADGTIAVEAVGSSPADQTVTIVNWMVREGDSVRSGQPVAELEADKAAFQLSVPQAGVVDRLVVAEGEPVPVGAVLMRIRPADGDAVVKRVAREEIGTPRLARRAPSRVPMAAQPGLRAVCLSGLSVAAGSEVLTNHQIAARFPGKDAGDIARVTGITSRCIAGPGEDAVSMGSDAAGRALAGSGLTLHDVSTVICCTTTPVSITPSLACRILHRLEQSAGTIRHDLAAYDVYAACSGYLYAMGNAFDQIARDPEAVVLVISAEHLSRVVDPDDFDTVVLFGDAATATVVSHPDRGIRPNVMLHRPLLASQGEDGSTILVPGPRDGRFVQIHGRRVFQEAVSRMTQSVQAVCRREAVAVESLRAVVPHQANGRIIQAIAARLHLPRGRVIDGIAHRGNTSSSSIPLVLAEHAEELAGTIALCAFGGGYTYGAALAEVAEPDSAARQL